MENDPADFVKAVLVPSCFLFGRYGLHMKGGGVLKEAHGKDDVEITLVNLSY